MPPSKPRALTHLPEVEAANTAATPNAMRSRYDTVRWSMVSGSPTVGGFGGYLRAGTTTTATKAAPATFATRWNSLRPDEEVVGSGHGEADHDADHHAVDDRADHAAQVLDGAGELGRLAGRGAQPGSVLELEGQPDLGLGEKPEEDRSDGAARSHRR